MRILVYPHDLGMGGSQLNAIELAAAVRDLGHAVVVFGQPGPLLSRIEELGLEFLPAPPPRRRPSPAVVRALRQAVRDRDIDVVHGYEWPPTLEGVVATRFRPGTTVVGTVMSMAVAPFLPRSVPLAVGTEQIAAAERAAGRRRVTTLEPPVDVDFNDIAAVAGQPSFRAAWHLPDEHLLLATVSRLAHEMKLEGILAAIDALPALNAGRPVDLVVAGDGPARAEVQARAEQTNRALGRRAVVLTGELPDPRSAYAAADVVLGMGGSALRALAFRRPLVVQGEQGFFSLLTPQTLEDFLWTGWYGVGPGPATGPRRLIEELGPVLADRGRREELGRFGRALIEDRFSLAAAARRQVGIYERALAGDAARRSDPLDLGRSGLSYSSYFVQRIVARRLRRAASDDFNSRPVAAGGPARTVPAAEREVARAAG